MYILFAQPQQATEKKAVAWNKSQLKIENKKKKQDVLQGKDQGIHSALVTWCLPFSHWTSSGFLLDFKSFIAILSILL